MKIGKDINTIRNFIEDQINKLKPKFFAEKKQRKLDLTLPGRMPRIGRKHPLTQTLEDIKGFFQSKTVWGALIAIAPPVASLFGYDIGKDDVAGFQTHLDSIITAVGALIAMYGRVTATTKIGKV